MFQRDADNKLVGRNHAPLFWTELPEFSHLQTYAPPSQDGGYASKKDIILKKQVTELLAGDGGGEGGESASKREDVKNVVTDAFLGFLAQLSGFAAERIDVERGGLGMYGIDSLSGVGCQYWFHRGELTFSLVLSSFLPACFHSSEISGMGYLVPISSLLPVREANLRGGTFRTRNRYLSHQHPGCEYDRADRRGGVREAASEWETLMNWLHCARFAEL